VGDTPTEIGLSPGTQVVFWMPGFADWERELASGGFSSEGNG